MNDTATPSADPVKALADHPAAKRPKSLAAAVEPLLVGRVDAARLCGVSRASWDRMAAAGKVGPVPIRLGGRILWRMSELRDWIAAGCPDRKTWELLRDRPAQRGGRRG